MTGGEQQRARIMAHVAAEIDAYMKRPCWPAPADGLTAIQHVRANTFAKVLAMAEWEAMRSDGSLPDWWPERRAQLEADWKP
jgi:hypothetical protein